ncbi:MAG: HtaA domain-containing protein, partial [Bifidobacteriaceae bacterium]|nr:HtaA domain-containing protein [Bifidobacteriaceae bacterium]
MLLPRHPRNWALAPVAAIIATLSLTPQTSVAAAAAETAGQVTGGSVTWGVKESLRRYVPSGGEAEDGATKLASGEFELPISSGTYDPSSRDLRLELEGTIVFDYAAHTFKFTFRDLSLEISPSSSTLSAEVTTTFYDQVSGAEASSSTASADLVTLDTRRGTRTVTPGVYRWIDLPTALTAQGADLFEATINGVVNRFYAEGEPFDALTINATGDEWPEEAYIDPTWTAPGKEVLVASDSLDGYFFTGGLGAVHDTKRGKVFAAAVEEDGTYSIAILNADTLVEEQRLAIVGYPNGMAVDENTGKLVVRTATSTHPDFRVYEGVTYTGALNVVAPDGNGGYRASWTLQSIPAHASFQPFFDGDGRFVSASNSSISGSRGLLFYDLDAIDTPTDTPAAPAAADDFIAFGSTAITYSGVYDQQSGLIHVVASSAANGIFTVDPTGESGPVKTPLQNGGGVRARLILDGDKLYASRTTGIEVLRLGEDGMPQAETTVALSGAPWSMVLDSATGLLWVESAFTGRIRALDTNDGYTQVASADNLVTESGLSISSLNLVTRPGDVPLVALYAGGSAVIPVSLSELLIISRYTTPAVTTQPNDAEVALEGASYGADGSLSGADPQAVEFTAAASGEPAVEIQWQVQTAYGWEDLVDDDVFSGVTANTLTVSASAASDGTSFRAVFRNTVTDYTGTEVQIGQIATDAASLTVTIVEPEDDEPADGGVIHPDGAITGSPNSTGASTKVTPGIHLAADS